MKKLVSLLLMAAMVATLLAGCGGGAGSSGASGSGAGDSREAGSSKEDSASGSKKESAESKKPTLPAENEKVADTLTFAQGADPRGLDPALSDDGESSKVMVNIYEGLLKYEDDSTKVLPCLAKSWTVSEDGLTYTFKLEEGVKFHDGTPFNAEAVKFNVDRQTVNVTEDMAYAGFVYQYVESCKVVDEYTVEIKLNSPCTPFLNNLAMSMAAPMVSPKACQESNNNLNENPVGTGPFRFVRWDKAEAVVLERNEDYWGDKAITKNLIFKIIPDNSARVMALNNNEADMIDGIDSTVIDQITAAGNEVFQAEGMNINYMAYNVEKLKDKEVRKALSQAVNVPELVQSLYQGYSTEATTILPTFMPGYGENVKQAGYDEAAAKAVLESKGIKTVRMITYTNPRPYNTATGQTLAEAIQGYFAKVGVTATIDSYDWTTYKDKIKAGDYDICFYGWNGDNGDADNFMNLLSDEDPTMNVARYKNPAYNDLIKKALATPAGSDRDALYVQMEQMVADDCAWLPISHSMTLSGYNPLVKNYSYHMTANVFLSKTYKTAN